MSILAIVLSLSISLILTSFVRRIAIKNGWFDPLDDRKIHKDEIPRLGGVAIFYSLVLTLLILALSGQGIFDKDKMVISYWPVIVAAFAIHLVGLVDDFRNLPARFKFLIQSAAALLVIGSGFHFRVMFVPWGSGEFLFGYFSYILTFFWIVGVTNAMNLIDGMDGLSGTITTVAAITFGAFFLSKGDMSAALICMTLLGSTLGFLVNNLPPAKIFMGDSGSLSVGFLLSVLPLLGQYDPSIEIGFLAAVTTLAIPIFDTATAMLRRILAGVHPFTPDKRHIHHKLMSLGLGPWRVLGLIGLANLILGLAALSTAVFSNATSFWCKTGVLLSLAISFLSMHYLTNHRRSARY
jgi:UDP-GlcNAc:undecaprenyl-phosphate GlcNAc-1-phosphate transferase